MEELPRKANYKKQLLKRKKELKKSIEKQNKKILAMSCNDENFIEEVSKINSLSVDLKIVISRIANYGIPHTGLETVKLIETRL